MLPGVVDAEGVDLFDAAAEAEAASFWRTTSSFHLLTIDFALVDNFISLCVLNFPMVLPMSVFYFKVYQNHCIQHKNCRVLLTFNNSPFTLILPRISKISKHVYN